MESSTDGAWKRVRAAIFQWNFGAAENAFHEFCTAHGVPTWFEDEYAFAGMQLWAAGRPASALRHFAVFFDKAAGHPGRWDPREGDFLAETEPLVFA